MATPKPPGPNPSGPQPPGAEGRPRDAAGRSGAGSGQGGGSGGDLTPEQRAAFQARADEIGKRLEAAKGGSETRPRAGRGGKGEVDGSGMGRALRVSTELIGGILVGSAIGWFLDSVFKTGPLLFILFFLLGSAAGILNVVRSTRPTETGKPARTPARPVKDDDEDDDK